MAVTAHIPHAIITVERGMFAVSTEHIREIVMLPEIATIPEVPDHVRGVMTLRGNTLPVIDVRSRLGYRSALEDVEAFCELLGRREQDHITWLAELEASVRERREFRLTLDPHACAFGKWYDSYKSNDVLTSRMLKKFDAPHKRIHGIGAEVRAHAERRDYAAAEALVESTRTTTLAELRRLFGELQSTIRTQLREVALIIESGGNTFAAAVDSVFSVEKLAPGQIESLPAEMAVDETAPVRQSGQLAKSGELVLILEADRLMNGAIRERRLATGLTTGVTPEIR